MSVEVNAPPRWAVRRVLALATERPDLAIGDLARHTGMRPMFVRACLASAGIAR